MDGCTKEIQYLRHLLQDLGESDGKDKTPVYNDNMGAIQWTETGSLTQKKLVSKKPQPDQEPNFGQQLRHHVLGLS